MILYDVVETLMIEEMRKKWRRKKKKQNKKTGSKAIWHEP